MYVVARISSFVTIRRTAGSGGLVMVCMDRIWIGYGSDVDSI